MENAAWRLALGGVRKRYQKAVSESVNSRGRRRSMWACAFRATFISSISFIYLLYLSPYSPLFTFIQQTLPLFTQFEGGGTESFSENGQARRQVGVRISRSVRGGGALGGLHTHTHTSSSVRKSNHASGNTSICGSA